MPSLPRELMHFAVDGKSCEILPHDFGFSLCVAGEVIHNDTDPRWLSKCALFSGALRVRWPFDFKGWD